MNRPEKIDFKQVYVAHFPKMKRFAAAYIFSEEEAENIVQDVFLELWERRDVLDMPVNLLAFLFTATKNRCIDYVRHKILVQETNDKLLEEQKIALKLKYDSLEAFDQSIFAENDVETVLQQAIDSLPEKCREIFIKSRIEGKKHKEIALELNISTHTIETQMGLAYKKLRSSLKNYTPLLLFLFS